MYKVPEQIPSQRGTLLSQSVSVGAQNVTKALYVGTNWHEVTVNYFDLHLKPFDQQRFLNQLLDDYGL